MPEPNTGCHIWTGSTYNNGYGTVRINKVQKCAHRAAWELFVGPIPEGLTIDHKCRNIWCVNPDHLEPVSMRENLMRSSSVSAVHAVKTHCPKGHPYSGDNLVMHHGSRECLTCRRARSLVKYQKLKAKGYRWRNRRLVKV